MRQMRAAMLEQLASEPVEQVRALGLPEHRVVWRHALPNALNPMVTLFGMTLGALLSGSFVAETLFSWPGLGSLTLDALLAQDTYLVVGAVLMVSVVLALGNLLADVLQAVLDPRVRHD
jgi:peptide/nickel transport system permease protein